MEELTSEECESAERVRCGTPEPTLAAEDGRASLSRPGLRGVGVVRVFGRCLGKLCLEEDGRN